MSLEGGPLKFWTQAGVVCTLTFPGASNVTDIMFWGSAAFHTRVHLSGAVAAPRFSISLAPGATQAQVDDVSRRDRRIGGELDFRDED
jgi:hypothetical protein